jgi:hypothetical protein
MTIGDDPIDVRLQQVKEELDLDIEHDLSSATIAHLSHLVSDSTGDPVRAAAIR